MVCVCTCVYRNLHLRSFGLVLSVEELWQGSSLNLMNAVRKGGKNAKKKSKFLFCHPSFSPQLKVILPKNCHNSDRLNCTFHCT